MYSNLDVATLLRHGHAMVESIGPFDVNRVVHGNCVDVMERLPAGCVDMVFADPPYNLQLKGELLRPDHSRVDAVDEAWDHFADFAAYDAFTRRWLAAVRRVLKPDGTLWVIGTYHNIFRVGTILQDLGYWVLNDIVWRKTNPMPNFRGRRFTNAHETLIWCSRDRKSRPRFNYHAMKSLNDDVQMRSDWLIPVCGGAERLKSQGQRSHPTQKPEALLHRVILSSSRPNELILDPFFGTGTTGVVARRLGRRFLGIEFEKHYVELAEERLSKENGAADVSLVDSVERRDEIRVAFGTLVERGLVPIGTILCDQKERYMAKVAADGSITSADYRGSIHQVGARVQNADACNGWQFWFIKDPENKIPKTSIDVFRQRARADLQ